ncbi:cytochrome c1 [Bordetella genomosp. 1]|uniref:Cytochrome c1 n=1 Tax=Bordetella genomosp. 1 TaxID=1395607 RepID=A0A261STY2_9BORD|nr:cytochrome c1 [Bordetella genomosp. 1]OZI40330.1 cytochrome c1 [Bordetella genomosp. 1]OZI68531.1 cytochrome c1 [Bordetella genomosp. 1]
MIKKLIGAVALMLTCTAPYAAEGGFPLDRAPNQVNDLASLQNGAKLFVNYCLNCHSAQSMRYNKLQEIGLTDKQILDNLLFTGEKVGDLMKVAMTPADAKKWFGTMPPDLSVIARAKSVNAGPSGADYIYTYLRTFYRDTSTKTGWNNLVFPSVGMPHALWERQGPRELTRVSYHKTEGSDGKEGWEKTTTLYDAQGFSSTKTESTTAAPGRSEKPEARFKALNPAQSTAYDRDVADLTAFMAWMAEPVQRFRIQLGVGVLIFLGLFLVVAWRLNAAYWKHVR